MTGPSHAGQDLLHTHGGRCLGVDRLEVDTARLDRVVMSVTCRHEERDHVWASLTAREARELAALLLAHADAVEHGADRGNAP